MEMLLIINRDWPLEAGALSATTSAPHWEPERQTTSVRGSERQRKRPNDTAVD
jgi:hypothetical protein